MTKTEIINPKNGGSKRAPRILVFSIAMDADYSFYVKTIETHARAFLALNILAISSTKLLTPPTVHGSSLMFPGIMYNNKISSKHFDRVHAFLCHHLMESVRGPYCV